MKLILTHEQADFDALASLFCASVLNEFALAVIPDRINRNARSFIILYGQEFPFIDKRDLPEKQVESVVLVDTQSLPTLRGMSKQTHVQVVDHHARRANLPPEWLVNVDSVGATTTLLVEQLHERDRQISAIQATLLLLGIYEDTGSLTYANTTPRDIYAAGHMLEQGASLKVATGFLDSHLSHKQQEMFGQLMNRAQDHVIQGYNVILTSAEMPQMNEEISLLVQKLDLLFRPNALFALISSAEGVRLIARSNLDEINVAEIAGYFGGGGHDRAASALIKSLDERRNADNKWLETRSSQEGRQGVSKFIEEQFETLLGVLPRFIHPSLIVAQVMSPLPSMLSPDTPILEAIDLMVKFDCEGLPVMKDGKVAGLLTRQAAKRAIVQSFHLNVADIMEVGAMTVGPEDPLRYLQSRMIESGWVQIPVVDPQTNNIIGVVTRSDILKALL